MKAESLNLTDPTLKDLAEIMMGGGNPEFVRMCLPHITRKRDDPWWNGVLLNATVPEGLTLILEHAVDPDTADYAGYTVLHHLASDYRRALYEEAGVIRTTMLLDVGESLTKRDSLLKSTPLGWACRWGRIELVRLYLERGADALEADARALGNASGMGYEARASRDYRVAPLAWRKLTCTELCRCRHGQNARPLSACCTTGN